MRYVLIFSILFFLAKRKKKSLLDEDHCEAVANYPGLHRINKSDTLFISLSNWSYYEKNENNLLYSYSISGAYGRFGIQEDMTYSSLHYDSINHISFKVYPTDKLTPSVIIK